MDKKIYHEKNGEVITYDADEFYVFSKSKMLEELLSYKTEESHYGYFRVILYYDKSEKKAYRVWLWIPTPGYSWSECIVEVCE
jgi:hypothetical protein